MLSPLGKRIVELKGEITDAELLTRLDLSRNQLYNIKRGKTKTTPETIARLVSALNLKNRDDIESLYSLAGFIAPYSSPVPQEMAQDDKVSTPSDLHALVATLSDQDRSELLYTAISKAGEVKQPNRRIIAINLDDGHIFEPDGTLVSEDRLPQIGELIAQLGVLYSRSKYSPNRLNQVLSEMREELKLPSLVENNAGTARRTVVLIDKEEGITER